jgi:hypothetical protein
MAPQILLVADSPGDVRLTKGAFREVNPSVRVHVANDSVEALGFLRREGAPLNPPRRGLPQGPGGINSRSCNGRWRHPLEYSYERNFSQSSQIRLSVSSAGYGTD